MAVVFLCVALQAPAASATVDPYWTLGKVLRKMDGTRVSIGQRRIRIVSESTMCSGDGVTVTRQGGRAWRRFTCTYTTFTKSGIDRDLDFRVRVVSSTRFVIVRPHWR